MYIYICVYTIVCDDGYWSPWATGGPCYRNGSPAEPPAGGNNQTGGGITGPNSTTTDCSLYTSADQCNRDALCTSLKGHTCNDDRWSFIECINKTTASNCMARSTCAVRKSDGARAWFATRCLPKGWNTTNVDSKCGSCCKPHQQPNSTTPGGNVGGCSFVNNSACVLLGMTYITHI